MVGFEEGETQRHHVEMAKDLVGPDKRLQMKSVVVTSPDSLVNIPPSKVRLNRHTSGHPLYIYIYMFQHTCILLLIQR